jgi:GAF domain-containing protein
MGRVARALVGSGSLAELAERALAEMREALGLELAVLYLPAPERRSLKRYVTAPGTGAPLRARDDVAFDEEAWRLTVASGVPLLFREEAGWLVTNPFEPAAQSWLVLPLLSEQRLVGVVVAAAEAPLSLEPTAAAVLSLLGDLLAAGIATARLRQALQGAEIERERMRLAAEIHTGSPRTWRSPCASSRCSSRTPRRSWPRPARGGCTRRSPRPTGSSGRGSRTCR